MGSVIYLFMSKHSTWLLIHPVCYLNLGDPKYLLLILLVKRWPHQRQVELLTTRSSKGRLWIWRLTTQNPGLFAQSRWEKMSGNRYQVWSVLKINNTKNRTESFANMVIRVQIISHKYCINCVLFIRNKVFLCYEQTQYCSEKCTCIF